MQISGYQIAEQIYLSDQTCVYRCLGPDNTSVIIKTPTEPYPSLRVIASYQYAFDLASETHPSSVIRHLELKRNEGSIALVMEDLGAQSLSSIIPATGLPLDRWLHLSVAIARVLAKLHECGVVHNNVNPSNIIIQADLSTPRLIDLSNSFRQRRHSIDETPLLGMGRSLAYLSPEQCGRIRGLVDSRSDLYSMGVLLFQAATGRLPFLFESTAELAHAHAARLPPKFSDILPEYPETVSRIVDRLLAKNADGRYASAEGLAHDLQLCLDDLQWCGTVRDFTLGQADSSCLFHIPDHLYGRESDLERLTEAVQRTIESSKLFITVSGLSGTGKTALLNQLQRQIIPSEISMFVGKYDQFTDLPYAGILKAIRELLRRDLAEPESILAQRRLELQAAIGVYGQLLTSALPELKAILGPQPVLESIPPQDAIRRFNLIVGRFLAVYATSEKPLVLFLDDMQWADRPTLSLIEALATDQNLMHLIIILSFRSNEVDVTHPLELALKTIRANSDDSLDIVLQPLKPEDVIHLLADTLRTDPHSVASLGTQIHEISAGSPLFISEFIYTLYERGFFHYDGEQHAWNWDLNRLHDYHLSENVATLISENLDRLEPACLDLLSTAACVGSEFDLRTLARVQNSEQPRIAAALAPAVRAGVIVPLDAQYKIFESLDRWAPMEHLDTEIGTASYRFQHDQVRQSVHIRLDSASAADRHLQIGRLLIRNLTKPELEQRVIEVFSHVIYGVHLLSDPLECRELAKLGLLASHRALRGLAFESAQNMLMATTTFLHDDAWTNDYATAIGIHLALAQCAYALSQWAEFEHYSQVVITRARSPVHSAAGYSLRIRLSNTQNDYSQAVDIGINVARSLGVKLPRQPRRIQILLWILYALVFPLRHSPEAGGCLPEAKDPRIVAAISLLTAVANPAYFTEPNLLPLIGISCSCLTIKHGTTPQSAYGLAVWALVLCGVLGMVDRGYQFGNLALSIGQRYRGVEEARARFVVDCFIKHWKESLSEVAHLLHEDWADNRDRGDAESATYCAGVLLYTHFFAGGSLDVEDRYAGPINYLLNDGVGNVKDCFLAWVQLYAGLGHHELQADLEGSWFSSLKKLPEFEMANNSVQIAISSIAAGILEFFANRFERAEASFSAAARLDDHIVSQVLVPGLAFFRGLNAYRQVLAGMGGKDSMRVARRERSRLRRWAKFAPQNLNCRLSLLDAEEAMILRRPDKAVLILHRAFEEASSGAVLYQAMAQSRLATVLTSLGANQSAQMAASKAAECYLLWGAPALASHVSQLNENATGRSAGTVMVPGTAPPDSDPFDLIDLNSMFHALATISSEIDEATLLAQLMPTVIQTAGADRGLLLLIDAQERVWVEAEANLQETLIKRYPLEEFPMHSQRVVSLALRSQSTVVIQDSAQATLLIGEAYAKDHHVISLLALGINLQGRRVGLLYLENHLAKATFTPKRVDITRALGVQASIALENARLYGRVQSALANQTVLANANRRFVPGQFLSGLGFDSIVDVNLNEAIERDMNVLFVDLRGFSKLSVQLGPRGTISLINRYLSHVQPGISAHGGFVAQYYGDGLLAIFPDAADKALRGAIAMCRGLEGYNQKRGESFPELNFGIGLHFGSLTLGTIGDQDYFQCTVVGDAVNVASRLEGLTKFYGTKLVLSASTVARVEYPEQFSLRALGKVQVQGRVEAFEVYECLACYPEKLRERITASVQTFLDGLAAYRSGDWDLASAAFADCVATCEEDVVARRFAQRCLERSQADVIWDGLERPGKG